jgi:hypothetical protein
MLESTIAVYDGVDQHWGAREALRLLDERG